MKTPSVQKAILPRSKAGWILLVLVLVLSIFAGVWYILQRQYPAAFGSDSQYGILKTHFVSGKSYSPAVGYSVPPLRLRGSGGAILDTEKDFQNGKPTLIVFEATWCTYCKQELPFLNRIARDARLNYASIDIHEPAPTVDSFVRENGITHPWFYDEDGSVSTWFLLAGTPTHLFIDRNGKIATRLTGYQSDDQLQTAVDELLK